MNNETTKNNDDNSYNLPLRADDVDVNFEDYRVIRLKINTIFYMRAHYSNYYKCSYCKCNIDFIAFTPGGNYRYLASSQSRGYNQSTENLRKVRITYRIPYKRLVCTKLSLMTAVARSELALKRSKKNICGPFKKSKTNQ